MLVAEMQPVFQYVLGDCCGDGAMLGAEPWKGRSASYWAC
jgi:hypothetical protein